jgi:hypothetical protein
MGPQVRNALRYRVDSATESFVYLQTRCKTQAG